MAHYVTGSGGVSVVESRDAITVTEPGARAGYSRYATAEPVTRSYVRNEPIIRSYVRDEPTTSVRSYVSEPAPVVVREPVSPVVVRENWAPSSPVRVVEPLRVVERVVEPIYSEPIRIVEDPVRYVDEPIRVVDQPRRILSEQTGTSSDWVVVEKPASASGSVIRHSVVSSTGVKTADGRYIIGESGLEASESGIIRLPDGRIKYADGTIKAGFPQRTALQGSIVTLADGTVLHPDGTMEYPDGTVRKPNNMTYSSGPTPLESINAMKESNDSALAKVTEQLENLQVEMHKEKEISASMVQQMKAEKSSEETKLKQQLNELLAEKKIHEKELTILKEGGPGGAGGGPWALVERLQQEIDQLRESAAQHPAQMREMLMAKEEELRILHEQYIAEAKAGAEAKGLLTAVSEDKVREVETREMMINEAVLRKEQLMAQQKEQEIANLLARETAEKEQIRVEASRQLEAEVAGERARAAQEVEEMANILDAERKRADEEAAVAAIERERYMTLEASLQAKGDGKKKKKKKKGKKSKKKSKKKAKGKAKPGVISGLRSKPKPKAKR
mmetsp:Transcript_40979/g.68821  ORF Transcript_40979/g.68821 Transcript_40979/m.68821 type:complete len:561 (+) Transcript_40979:43-1725(+)